MVYLDAAFIAKFYIDEPDSDRVRKFLLTAQPALSCIHAMAEVASVFVITKVPVSILRRLAAS